MKEIKILLMLFVLILLMCCSKADEIIPSLELEEYVKVETARGVQIYTEEISLVNMKKDGSMEFFFSPNGVYTSYFRLHIDNLAEGSFDKESVVFGYWDSEISDEDYSLNCLPDHTDNILSVVIHEDGLDDQRLFGSYSGQIKSQCKGEAKNISGEFVLKTKS